MSKQGKKPEDGRTVSDAEAEGLLREMMLDEGWLAPETEEGVARAEAAMGPAELPPGDRKSVV